MISRRSRVFAQTVSKLFSGSKTSGRKRSLRTGSQDHPTAASVSEFLESRALLTPLIATSVSQSGPVVLTAPDSAAIGDDLTVGAGISVESQNDSVTLNAGDNALLLGTSTVSAATTITVNLDFGDADAGVGSDSVFEGALNAVSVQINGGLDDDSISLSAASYSTSPVTYAAAGGTNNRLDIDVTGVTSPSLVITGPDSGMIQSDSHQDVSYSDVANTISSATGNVFPSGGDFQALVIDLNQLTAGNNASTDTILLVSNGSGAVVVSVNGQTLATAAETHFNEIIVTGSGDSDQLFIDHSQGIIGLPISFSGGGGLGLDTLHVIGDTATNAVLTPSSVMAGNGTVNIDGGGGLVTFTGVGPVDISEMDLATVDLPNSASTLNLADGAAIASSGQAAIQLTGSSAGVPLQTIALFNNSSLLIDVSVVSGIDSVTVSGLTGAHGNANLAIDTGGDVGDEITFAGSVTTSGAQTYSNAVVDLTNDIVLTSLAGGNITFSNAPIDGAQALTINTSGNVILEEAVGGDQPLTSLTTDSGGTTTLPAVVSTSGFQTYNDSVILGTNVAMLASTVRFNDDVDALAFGMQSLDIAGDLILGDGPGDNIGLTNPLSHLMVGGTTLLNSNPGVSPTISTTDSNGGSGTQTFGGAVALVAAADATLSAEGGDVNFQSTIDGPASLTVNSNGATIFSGAVGGSSPLSSLTTNVGGSTELAASVTTLLNQTYNDAVSITAGGVTLTGSSVDINNTVDLSTNTLSISAADADNRVTGSISGAGGLNYDGSSAGTLFLDADSSYSGVTQLISGTLVVASATSLGSGAGETIVVPGSTLQLAGDFTSPEPISLAGVLDVAAGITAELTGPVDITSASAEFSSEDAAATLEISGVISGTDGLNKTGPGTLTLAGTNTYTGSTNVADGTLLVTGSLAAGTSIAVQNSAILGGDGVIAGDVNVVTGGIVGPGLTTGASGALEVGNFNLQNGATLAVDISGKTTAGTDYDALTVNGTVSLAGTLDINDTVTATGVNGDTILLISNDGVDGVSGTFDGLAPGAAVTINGQSWRILYDGGDGNDVVLAFSPANITIADITVAEGTGGTTDFTFTATLDSPVGGSFQVGYSTSDDSANVSDGDYTAALGNLSFNGLITGETQTVTVSVAGDSKVELNERFFLNLNNIIVGTNSATPVISDSQGIGNITNDDQATISINNVSMLEGDSGTSTLTFDVTLDAAVDTALTVDFATAADSATSPSDFAAQSGQLSFAGTADEVETISIVVSGDTDEETDEAFNVLLSNLQAAGRSVTIANDTGVGTITDDDRIAVEISADISVGTEADQSVITLTAQAASEVSGSQTVDLLVTGSGVTADDFILSATTITIPDGQTTGTVTFTIQNDAIVELLETATISLTNASSGIRVGTVASVDVEISDDDSATVSIDHMSVNEGTSGTTQVAFTITLDNAVDTGISVNYQTVNGSAMAGSDFTADSSTLNFAGNAGETMTIIVDVLGDQLVELDETFVVELSGVSAFGRNVTLADAQGIGTITNDDSATISVNDLAFSEGNSGQTAFNFTLTLDAAVDTAITVDAATAGDTAIGGSDYIVLAATPVSFSGTAGETQSVTIQVIGDNVVEADESFFLNLTNVSAGGRNVTLSDSQGAAFVFNDDAGVPVNLSMDLTATATEATTTVVTLTVTADSAVAGDQTVDIDVTGTGITADDFTLSSATITIPDGQTTGTATFTVIDDALVELLETATVSLSNLSLGLLPGTTTSQEIRISDNDAARLSIDNVTMNEGGSGSTVFSFTVTLDNAVDTSVTVDFDTTDGLATVAGGDFIANTGGTLTFSGTAGETQTIDVVVLGDTVVERSETFLVNLSNIVAGSRNVTFADNQGLGTITNDDSATLSISDVSLEEGDSGITNFVFSVTLDNAVDVALTVDYDTVDDTAASGSDFTASNGNSLAFTGLAGETRTVTISVTGDATAELDEKFFVNLSNVVSSTRDVTIANGTGTGTIIDDDGIPVDLTADVLAGTEADGTVVTLTLTAASAVTGDQTIDLLVTGTNVTDDDYTLSTQTVVIPDGETEATVIFTIANDAVAELTEIVTISLANPSVQISQGAVRSQTITITDNDEATFTISDASVAEGDAGVAVMTFTVTLDTAVDSPVSVDVTTADGTAVAGADYTAASTTLNFAGIAGETQTFVVEIAGDTVVELDEILTATLSNAVGNGQVLMIGDAVGDGTITNDDAASLSIADVSIAEGDSGTSDVTFTVTLTGDVDTSFTVDFATSDDSATVADGDYTAASGTLTFAGTDGETQTFTVSVAGDTIAESTESFLATLSNLSAGGRNVTLADSSAIGTITDEDGVPVSLDVSVTSGTEAAQTVISVLALASSPVVGDQTVTVEVTGSGITGTDFILGNATITILSGQTFGTTTFTIADDTDVEATETAVLTLSNPSSGVSLGTDITRNIQIVSDDTASLTIDDVTMSEGASGTTDFTFTVTLDSALSTGFTVDYATADGTATVAGNDYASSSGTLTFVGTAGETQTITVSVTGDSIAETTESFFVNLSGLTGNIEPVVITDSEGVGTITTDDQVLVTLSASPTTGTEAAGTVITLTATADQAVVGDQTVNVTVSGTGITSGDYLLSSATITIFDGQTTGTATFTVQADDVLEGTETATVAIDTPSSGIILGATTSADVSITDSTRPTLDSIAYYPGVRPTVTWQPVSGAVRYEIWFSRITPAQSRIFSETTLTSTSYTPPVDLAPAVYRYWVRAFDASGTASRWSSDNNFEVQPTLVAPLNPTFNLRPAFTWEPIPFATAYQIFVRTRTGDIIETNLTSTSWTPSADLPPGPIRWWIRATDSIGNRGWSQVGLTNVDLRTTVTGPIAQPASNTPTITWQQVDGAGRYILHVQRLGEANPVIREDQLTGTSYTPSAGLASGTYRVWVKAINGATNSFRDSLWSSPRDFTISSIVAPGRESAIEGEVGHLLADTDSKALQGDSAQRDSVRASLVDQSDASNQRTSGSDRTSVNTDGSSADETLASIDALMAEQQDLTAWSAPAVTPRTPPFRNRRNA